MKGIIELSRAIKIDGKEITELSYDTDKITVDLYLKAINRAVTQGNGITGANLKLDAGAHLTLGMYAVIAENPAYDISDIERVTGSDLIKFVDIGMLFTLGREAQTSTPSDQQSEDTAELFTQA